jgi:hypothetical protein
LKQSDRPVKLIALSQVPLKACGTILGVKAFTLTEAWQESINLAGAEATIQHQANMPDRLNRAWPVFSISVVRAHRLDQPFCFVMTITRTLTPAALANCPTRMHASKVSL